MEKIKQIIEQLEDSKAFIKKDTINNYRISFMLTDNVVELMLKDLSETELYKNAVDSALNLAFKQFEHVMEEVDVKEKVFKELSNSKIKQIKKTFPAKVNYLVETDSLDEITAACLNELHDIRNATYHHAITNKNTIYIFSLLYFRLACKIFVIHSTHYVISSDPDNNLAYLRYGIRKPLDINSDGPQVIANSLISDMHLELEQVCEVLIESLLKYKNQIDNALKDILYYSNFKTKEDAFKIAISLIKKSKYPTQKEFDNTFLEVDEIKIDSWIKSTEHWKEDKCIENVFLKYIDLENQLIQYVDAFERIASDIESYIQIQIDIARGK